MTDEQFERLLKLTEENNKMLKDIKAYVDKVSNPKTIDNDNVVDFLMNIAANIIAGRIMDNGGGDAVCDAFSNLNT